MKKTYCDTCPHAFTELCYGCAYADAHGFPNVSNYDPDDIDEGADDTNKE